MKNKSTKYYIIALLLVLLDQASKLHFKSHLSYGEVMPIIGNFLSFTYIENQGMAFGITFGWGKIFLSLFSLIASGVICYGIYKFRDKLPLVVGIAASLILAGAFGNSIDRCFYGVIFGTDPLFYGRVVDFILVDIPDIDFLWLHYTYFPVFNIADSCVTCGVVLLLLMHKQILFLENNSENGMENSVENKTDDE
ncbi:MAG: signal peptidase II [Ignavibacteria bacterium]|jgi:signal peptidase II|nr:signal peptidase II [Ignavibacteria bacterium]